MEQALFGLMTCRAPTTTTTNIISLSLSQFLLLQPISRGVGQKSSYFIAPIGRFRLDLGKILCFCTVQDISLGVCSFSERFETERAACLISPSKPNQRDIEMKRERI